MNIKNIEAISNPAINPDVAKAVRTKAAVKAIKGQPSVIPLNNTEETESANKPKRYEKMVEELNKALSGTKFTAQYAHDKDTNTIIFKLIDDSGRIIRQIPPDEILKLKAFFRGQSGILIDKAI